MQVHTFAGPMIIDPNDCWIRNHMMGGRMFEQDLIVNILKPYIEKSKYIVDVGANIGCHTVSYGHLNPSARIYSFEPQDLLFKILSQNVSNNDLSERVTLYKKGLAHKSSESHMSHESTQYFNMVGGGINKAGLGIGEGGEAISLMTLDELNLPGLDFMKVDVEGAEGLVFMGAEKTIRKYKPIICFEHNYQKINPSVVGLETVPTPFEMLTKFGYKNYVHVGDENYIAT